MLDCRRLRWTVLGGLIISSSDAQSDPGQESFGRSVAQWSGGRAASATGP